MTGIDTYVLKKHWKNRGRQLLTRSLIHAYNFSHFFSSFGMANTSKGAEYNNGLRKNVINKCHQQFSVKPANSLFLNI